MAVPRIPEEAHEQLRWLVDRAAISDLLVEYARCVDEKDWAGFAALYTSDGVLEIVGGRRTGHAEIEAAGELVAAFDATHHVSTNHGIHVDGNTASVRANVIASHVPEAGARHEHADLGGIYEASCRRTPEGWRFSHVRGRGVWTNGGALPSDVRAQPQSTNAGAGSNRVAGDS